MFTVCETTDLQTSLTESAVKFQLITLFCPWYVNKLVILLWSNTISIRLLTVYKTINRIANINSVTVVLAMTKIIATKQLR